MGLSTHLFKKCFIILSVIILYSFFIHPHSVSAIENPLAVPNNKFGVHILFPDEINDAAKLIDSNGGDYGYVTIPIQSTDRDLKKWQNFMDQAKKLHVIPLVRLATEGDYFNTHVWRKPTENDILDFANFLNSLNWPQKNRYVIIFNETNRGDEWGGKPNPSEYATILNYAVTVFKSKSPDFFIISAGMDNAAANTADAMNEYTYLQQMNAAISGIFNQVDGFGSHSYPNPAFMQPPTVVNSESIGSFQFESFLIRNMISKQLPIFITETGWSRENLSDGTIGSYFQNAFNTIWSDSNIVAITPFLLHANSGPFTAFSLFNADGSANLIYQAIFNLTKVKGLPVLPPRVLGTETIPINIIGLPVKTFSATVKPEPNVILSPPIKVLFKWFLRLEI